MNTTRKGIVMKVFSKLDKEGKGELDLEDVMRAYSAEAHPDVVARKKTKEMVWKEFAESFELYVKLNVWVLVMVGCKDDTR
jgi:hypothetical protein